MEDGGLCSYSVVIPIDIDRLWILRLVIRGMRGYIYTNKQKARLAMLNIAAWLFSVTPVSCAMLCNALPRYAALFIHSKYETVMSRCALI